MARYRDYFGVRAIGEFGKAASQNQGASINSLEQLLDILGSACSLLTADPQPLKTEEDGWGGLEPELRFQVCVFGLVPDLRLLDQTIQQSLLSDLESRVGRLFYLSEAERAQLVCMADVE